MGTTLADTAPLVRQRRDVYEQQFGLAAVLEPDLSVIVLDAGLASGLRVVGMPNDLGHDVRTELRRLGTFDVPVISHARSDCACRRCRTWLFLASADPADPDDYHQDAILYLSRVEVWMELRVVLPTPGDPRRVWIDPPTPHRPPALAEVVAGVYRTLGEGPIR